jgi:hypothetical protein
MGASRLARVNREFTSITTEGSGCGMVALAIGGHHREEVHIIREGRRGGG